MTGEEGTRNSDSGGDGGDDCKAQKTGFDRRKEAIAKLTRSNASFIAGALAGSISRVVAMPFDVVKIRLQLQLEPYSMGKYVGMGHCVKTIVKEEGISSLWKGHISSQALSIGYSMLQFPTYEWATKVLKVNFGINNEMINSFVSGNTAAFVATCATFPLDTIRTRMVAQGEPKIYIGFFHALGSMVKHEGPLSLYRGLSTTLIGVMPYIGVSFATYISTKRFLASLDKSLIVDTHESTTWDKAIAGGMAGFVSKCIVHPFDVVKKREQVVGFCKARRAFGKVGKSYGGTLRAFVKIVRAEGVRGVFKGLFPSLAKAVPSSMIVFLVYDGVRNVLLHKEL
eukprot:m.28536 g.28536  ORF g.28536 m.28536 type:complete len:340 (+) comp6059_c0_seq2:156-1175(+)